MVFTFLMWCGQGHRQPEQTLVCSTRIVRLEVWRRCYQTARVSHSTPGKLPLPNPSWVEIPRRRSTAACCHGFGEERIGLGREGTDVHREELAVVIGSVPVSVAPRVPCAGPELHVRCKRVDHRRVRIAPAAASQSWVWTRWVPSKYRRMCSQLQVWFILWNWAW